MSEQEYPSVINTVAHDHVLTAANDRPKEKGEFIRREGYLVYPCSVLTVIGAALAYQPGRILRCPGEDKRASYVFPIS